MAVFIVRKENLEEQLQKYWKVFERSEETLEENEEKEKSLENYKSFIMEASKLLNHLKGAIKGHQQMLEVTQWENQRKAELEEQENQRKAELEREKLCVDEKLQLEKVNLEQLKIETDAKIQREKSESEMRLRESENKKRDTNLAIDILRH